MMQYVPPHARRRRARTQAGLAMLAFVVLVVAGAGAILFVSRSSRLPVDPRTLCPEDISRIPAYLVVILDATDPLNRVQQEFVREYLDNELRKLPVHARVALYLVDATSAERTTPFELRCNPGDGSQISYLNANPREARKRWETFFDKPLEDAVRTTLESSPSRLSPILETIVAASVGGFPQGGKGSRRLIIVSDLLQHSPVVSHYGERPPSFTKFQRAHLLPRFAAQLGGTSVTILYLRRDDPAATRAQGRRHINFWDRYFESIGGRVDEVVRVPG